ncbi:MAG: M48 family metalloprotease [Cytophagales bacterium]|nr:M48 family metalloprotease [Cytophagales bacterium]
MNLCVKIYTRAIKNAFMAVVLIGLLSSCSAITQVVPIGFDKMLGEQFSNQLNNNPIQYPILEEEKNPELYAYVNQMVQKILKTGKVAHKDDFKWDIHIVKDDSVLNAFCVAGGHIYVYTGLIKYLDSEDQLAGVLGHEIAHADLRHTTGQIIKNYSISFAVMLIFGNDFGLLAQIGQQLAGLTFSRSDEQEADEAAVEYLYYTDYDARGVGGFFKKLTNEKKDTKVPEFLSTHPASENRIQDIEATWQKLGGKTGKTYASQYQKIKESI